MEIKTLEQIKDDVAKDHGWDSYNTILDSANAGVIDGFSFADFWEDVTYHYAQQFQSPTDTIVTEISVMQERIAELEDVLKDIHFQYFWNGNDLTIHHKDKIESLINKGK